MSNNYSDNYEQLINEAGIENIYKDYQNEIKDQIIRKLLSKIEEQNKKINSLEKENKKLKDNFTIVLKRILSNKEEYNNTTNNKHNNIYANYSRNKSNNIRSSASYNIKQNNIKDNYLANYSKKNSSNKKRNENENSIDNLSEEDNVDASQKMILTKQKLKNI